MSDLNGNAIVVAGEGRVRTDFFGLTGHQLFGTTFSNKKFTSIDQRLDQDVIENGVVRAEKGSWNIYYNFDQYLYEPKKGVDRGVGVFGRLGVSDGNPNFMKFFGSFGVGGKGMFESRPHDQFGWGFYYINIDNPRLASTSPASGFISERRVFARRVWIRGLLQFCDNAVGAAHPGHTGHQRGSERQIQRRPRSPGGAAPHRQKEHKHIHGAWPSASVAVLMIEG